jgi:glycosyltransferase involved in cell wall biosynthesis
MRVLLLTHFFPPQDAIAARRPYAWARAWADSGHEVHVVTPEKYAFDGPLGYEVPCDGIEIHHVSYAARFAGPATGARSDAPAGWSTAKRITRKIRQRAGILADPRVWAVRALTRRAREIVASRKIDLLVSTYAPASPHIAASRVAASSGIPWAADYQDLWTDNYADPPGRFRHALSGRFEKRVLRNASMLFTLSHGLASHLHTLLCRPANVAYFGYDETAAEPQRWSDSRKHIVYTGRTYPEHQPVAKFLEMLGRALVVRPELEASLTFDFYGPEQEPLRRMAQDFNVETITRFHGDVPHAVARAAQRGAAANLFLDWLDADATGVLPAKLFEYLASGTPIVAFSGAGESESALLIEDCRAGIILKSQDALLEFLIGLPDSLPHCERDANRVAALSSHHQAMEMLRMIETELRDLVTIA